MMLKIGEKIKELREKKNITQSKMAEYLGITEQAISRWENGGGYPDMELIPGISNFLDVSTDELFETDRKEDRLKSLLKEAYKNTGWDHRSNCRAIEMYRNILKEFPNHYVSMFHLIVHLGEENHNPKGQHSEEIIALSNRIIKDCPDVSLCRVATNTLAGAYKHIGEQEKALAIVKESSILHSVSSGIGYSRENILSHIAEGEEKWENRKDVLQHLCNELCIYMRHYTLAVQESPDISGMSNEKWLEMIKRNIIILEKIDKIMEAFYEDRDYGFLRESMIYTYSELALYYMLFGEHEKALDNIEKCAEAAIIFDTDIAGKHTSVLVENLRKDGDYNLSNHGNRSENVKYNQCYRLIHDWFLNGDFHVPVPVGDVRECKPYREFYSPLHETDRFKAIIRKLEKYAEIQKFD